MEAMEDRELLSLDDAVHELLKLWEAKSWQWVEQWLSEAVCPWSREHLSTLCGDRYEDALCFKNVDAPARRQLSIARQVYKLTRSDVCRRLRAALQLGQLRSLFVDENGHLCDLTPDFWSTDSAEFALEPGRSKMPLVRIDGIGRGGRILIEAGALRCFLGHPAEPEQAGSDPEERSGCHKKPAPNQDYTADYIRQHYPSGYRPPGVPYKMIAEQICEAAEKDFGHRPNISHETVGRAMRRVRTTKAD